MYSSEYINIALLLMTGIIKTNGVVVISASQPQSVVEVIRTECTLRNATLVLAENINLNPPNLSTLSAVSTSTSTSTTLYPIQSQNIGVAATALKLLFEKKPPRSVAFQSEMFSGFYWPCRC